MPSSGTIRIVDKVHGLLDGINLARKRVQHPQHKAGFRRLIRRDADEVRVVVLVGGRQADQTLQDGAVGNMP